MTRSRLFNRAFLRGMAQAIDLTGGLASRRLARLRTGRRSVRNSLASDWAAVGHDLSIALQRYREAHGQ